MMNRISIKFYNVFWNVFTIIANLFIKRDAQVILCGAWMGEKFADNSRYLFQYLFKNKEKLNLKKVIWVTRNTELREQLSQTGYETYIIGTKESTYWHLKSGYHILCNAAIPGEIGDSMDMDIRFSWGAKRIQLWHGVGMKATGHASNSLQNAKSETKHSKILHNHYFLTVFTSLGGWKQSHYLCTSEKNAKVNWSTSGCRYDDLFISAYPRNCSCLELLSSEKKVVEEIQRYGRCIVYVPTFRSDHSHYIHPLEDKLIRDYIIDHNIIWVEKPHPASKFHIDIYDAIVNVLLLDAKFDINVLYPYIDLVISDYSSTVFDAVYKSIPVIMYAPDLLEFMNGDIGFVFDVPEYCDKLIAKNVDEVVQIINQILNGQYFTDRRREIFQNIMNDYFNNRESKYDEIWNDILCLKE